MIFTTPIFLLYFLPVVLAVYYLCPRGWRNLFLTLSSYVFYGWWSPWFVSLMAISTVVDWFCGGVVTRPGASERQRKSALLVSVLSNLSLLGFFKYFVFAQSNLNRLIEAFGGEPTVMLAIVLPVGISFYSLQSMSYTIDLYRGQAKRAKTFADFACYVAMFPQLVAGPIVRYREIAGQLQVRPQRGELFHLGVLNFIIGFAKKVVLANVAAEIADITFASSAMSPATAWFGLFGYHFQLYFDFSGYSDMAIGLGQMLGFTLPVNFRSPYRSKSATEFWRTWHISLSMWLRDYLYIPLGGSRRGIRMTYRNLLITMLAAGLWHGAEWNYVIWGAYTAVWLVAERMTGRDSLWPWLPKAPAIALTSFTFMLSWVIFRSRTFDGFLSYVDAMWGGSGDPAAAAITAARVFTPYYFTVIGVCAVVTYFGVDSAELVKKAEKSRLLTIGLFALFLFSIVVMYSQADRPFIYFQF